MSITLREVLPVGVVRGRERSGRRRFIVNAPPTTDVDDIIEAVGGVGHTHPDDTRLRAQSIAVERVSQTDSLAVYDVQITYAEPELMVNPIGFGRMIVYAWSEPQCEWSTEEVTIPFTHSVAGNAVVNTLGEPFDPVPERTVFRAVLHVVAPIRVATPSLFSFVHTVNANNWTVDGGYIPAGWGLLDDMRISAYQQEEGGLWRTLSYRVVIRSALEVPPGLLSAPNPRFGTIVSPNGEPSPTAWDEVILNTSCHAIDQQSGVKRRAFVGAHPAAEPVPIDANGREIPPGNAPVWIRFSRYPTANWSPLPRPL